VYACDDSCADSLIENNICNEINSLSLDSSNSPFFVTHTPSPSLELKPFSDSLKYVFLDPNETYPVIIASDLNEDQEGKLLKVFRKNKETIWWTFGDIKDVSLPLYKTKFILRRMLNLIKTTKDV